MSNEPPPKPKKRKPIAKLFGTLLATVFGILTQIESVKLPQGIPKWWLWVFCGALLAAVLAWSYKDLKPWVRAKELFLKRHLRISLIVCVLILSFAILGLSIWLAISVWRVAELSGTKFIGKFPKNIPAICELIEGAKTEVIIVVDHAAYGKFSQLDLHKRYIKAIRTAAEKPSVEGVSILTYDNTTATNVIRFQIGQRAAGRDTLVQSADYRAVLHQWAKRKENEGHESPVHQKAAQDYTVGEFIDAGIFEDGRVIQQLKSIEKVVPEAIHDEVPLYIWIVDGKKAIFSFYTAGADTLMEEVSFYTTDRNVVDLLYQIYLQRKPTKNPSSGK